MDNHRAGKHYPRSLGEFQSWFRADADCLDYLEWLRWPTGFVCPACQGPDGWRMGDGRFKCAACGARSSVTGHRRNDLRPHAHPADLVVHRLLAVRHRQGRDRCAESEAHPRRRFLPD
ncbi:MAG: transposase, partial [Betaproteobacteria bacterium]